MLKGSMGRVIAVAVAFVLLAVGIALIYQRNGVLAWLGFYWARGYF